MKKVFSLVLVVILCIAFGSYAFAEQPDAITFRGISWYTNAEDVNNTIKAIEGAAPSRYSARTEKADMQSWFKKWPYYNTDECVDEGGVILKYTTVPVAGYSAGLSVYCMYPIVDGKVAYDSSQAEFYMAIYAIDGFEDLYSVYTDLQTKLDKTYGSHVDQSFANGGMEGVTWTAKDGSVVWLRIRQNTVYKNYEDVQITYFAPNGNERLNALSAQIYREAVDAENAERENNTNNFDGL